MYNYVHVVHMRLVVVWGVLLCFDGGAILLDGSVIKREPKTKHKYTQYQ